MESVACSRRIIVQILLKFFNNILSFFKVVLEHALQQPSQTESSPIYKRNLWVNCNQYVPQRAQNLAVWSGIPQIV